MHANGDVWKLLIESYVVVVVWGESRDGRNLVCSGKCGISEARADLK